MDYKTKCLTGEIPRNKRDYQGGVILFNPRLRRHIRIMFGTGDNLSSEDMDEKDENGNGIDDYMYVTTYKELHAGDDVDVLEAEEDDGGMMLFSHETYKSGDIREMLEQTLDFMDWPDNLDEYVFISTEDD